MIVTYGKGTTEYGPGVSIELSGDEVATAIDAYLVAHGIHVSGPRTITINGDLCEDGHVYVDPSGFVIANGEKIFRSRGGGVPGEGGAEMSDRAWGQYDETREQLKERRRREQEQRERDIADIDGDINWAYGEMRIIEAWLESRLERAGKAALAAAFPPDPAPETRTSAIIAGCAAMRDPETGRCRFPDCTCDVPEIVDAALRDFRASLLPGKKPS